MPDNETVTIPSTDAPLGDPLVIDDQESAPWGYKDDGTPYKRDPAIYAKRDAGKSKRSTSKSKTKTKGPDYTDDVKGLLQLVSIPVAVAATQNRAFLADVVAIDAHADPIASAINEIALEDERVAAVLERLSKVGPYGLLVAAVTPLIAQIAANHGALRPGVLQTVDPDALIASVLPPDATSGPTGPGTAQGRSGGDPAPYAPPTTNYGG